MHKIGIEYEILKTIIIIILLSTKVFFGGGGGGGCWGLVLKII